MTDLRVIREPRLHRAVTFLRSAAIFHICYPQRRAGCCRKKKEHGQHRHELQKQRHRAEPVHNLRQT